MIFQDLAPGTLFLFYVSQVLRVETYYREEKEVSLLRLDHKNLPWNMLNREIESYPLELCNVDTHGYARGYLHNQHIEFVL